MVIGDPTGYMYEEDYGLEIYGGTPDGAGQTRTIKVWTKEYSTTVSFDMTFYYTPRLVISTPEMSFWDTQKVEATELGVTVWYYHDAVRPVVTSSCNFMWTSDWHVGSMTLKVGYPREGQATIYGTLPITVNYEPRLEVTIVSNRTFYDNETPLGKDDLQVKYLNGQTPILLQQGQYGLEVGQWQWGNVTVKVTYGDLSKSFTVFVNRRTHSLSDVTIESIEEQTYNGKEITPTLVVKYGNNTLTKDTDYTVAYENNINVGTATVTVTGKGSYTGSATREFTINPRTLRVKAKDVEIVYGDDVPESLEYGFMNTTIILGETPKVTGTVKIDYNTEIQVDSEDLGDNELDKAYSIVMDDLQLVDNGAFLASNYEIEFVPGKFIIYKAENPTIIQEKTNLNYTGDKQELFTVENLQGKVYYLCGHPDMPEELTKENYTQGTNGIAKGQEPGDYYINCYVPGDEHHKGKSFNLHVTINGDLHQAEILLFDDKNNEVTDDTYTYDGTEKKPKVILKWQDSNIVLPTEFYTVTYENNKNAGLAYIKISANEPLSITGEEIISESFKINQRELNVIANDQRISIGDRIPELTYTYNGEVNGQTPKFSGKLAVNSEDTVLDVGEYDINLGTLTLDSDDKFLATNYKLKYTKGKLTVCRLDNRTRVYAKQGLIWSNHEQELVEVENLQGDIYFSLEHELNKDNYSDGTKDKITAKDPGNYRVYWYATGDDSHSDAQGSVSVNIAISEPFKFKEESNYEVIEKDDTTYVTNISSNTTILDFYENILNYNGIVEIYRGDEKITAVDYSEAGETITHGDILIGTGMRVVVTTDYETKEFVIVVEGDTSGDGKISIQDMLDVNAHRLGKHELEGPYLIAGDVNEDDQVNIRDIMKMNLMRLGKIFSF